MKKMPSVFTTGLIVMSMFSVHAQLPSFSEKDKSFTTSSFTKGVAMDIAHLDNLSYILGQNAGEKGDLIGVFTSDGTFQKNIDIEKHNASAIETFNNNLFVMSRSAKFFIRQFDGNGTCLKTIALKNKPSGKYYGLALIDDRFYFLSWSDSLHSTALYSVNASGEDLKTVATFSGKGEGLCTMGKELLMHIETQGYRDDWLYYIEPGGKIKDSLAFPYGTGLDSHAGAVCMLRQKDKCNATVITIKTDRTLKRVYYEPRWKNVALVQSYVNKTMNPGKLDVYFTKPKSNEYQLIKNLNITPHPKSEKTDNYGNTWMMFEADALTDSLALNISFDIYTCHILYTLPFSASQGSNAPSANGANYNGTTSVFDYDNTVFDNLPASYAPAADFTANVLTLRNTINDNLAVVGPSGPEVKASLFLQAGVGRCYAHTISFAALARKKNIAASAVGGINISENASSSESKEEAAVHTWNRIYHPSGFWFDVDAQGDDQKNGNHTMSRFGFHSGDYYISFIGDYAKKDNKSCFAERNWISVYEYSSVNHSSKAKISSNPLRINVKPIAAFN